MEDYVHAEDEVVTEEEYGEWESDDQYSYQSTFFSCDTCEREFYSQEQFDTHMSEHRTCNLEGCTFTAHEKIIEKHIQMQHSTGLYERIKNLNTPEDIAKWIAERKKKYPSKENIEKRYKEQEARIQRGERILKKNDRFGKDKYRLAKAEKSSQALQQAPKKKKKPKPQPKASLIDEKSDWNGKMFPFRGTSELFGSEDDVKAVSDFDDDEWQEHSGIAEVKINNALGSLMAAYGSDSEDDTVAEEPKNTTETKASNPPSSELTTSETATNLSDGEAPDEQKIVKQRVNEVEEVASTSRTPPNKEKRKRSHQRGSKTKRKKLTPENHQTVPERRNRDNFPHNKFKKRKVTLLEKLLENEIRHERNLILQCVRYVVQNNFFESS